jgi:hypothetical protein
MRSVIKVRISSAKQSSIVFLLVLYVLFFLSPLDREEDAENPPVMAGTL